MNFTVDYAAVTVRAEKQIRGIMVNADLANDEAIASDMRQWAQGVLMLWRDLVSMVGDAEGRHAVQVDDERLSRLCFLSPPVARSGASLGYQWIGEHA